MKKLILLFITIYLFTGCSIKHASVEKRNVLSKPMQDLSHMIQSISNKIDSKEANDISKKVITQSKKLANKYSVIAPALFHNTLINMGLKEKGYCYHYANDLLIFLEEKEYKSFKFKKIVSNRGEYFEHTAIILTRDDIEFENSIVLDAWRNSGILFFSKLKDDKRYDWKIK